MIFINFLIVNIIPVLPKIILEYFILTIICYANYIVGYDLYEVLFKVKKNNNLENQENSNF